MVPRVVFPVVDLNALSSYCKNRSGLSKILSSSYFTVLLRSLLLFPEDQPLPKHGFSNPQPAKVGAAENSERKTDFKAEGRGERHEGISHHLNSTMPGRCYIILPPGSTLCTLPASQSLRQLG